MGQTLDNGIYLPSKGERNCYDGLAANWTTLDSVVGGYRAHVANENIHITSAERSKWNTGVTQAYVLRYANTSLTALGTVAFSALDNTDNVKIGDKVLDSEGKLFALTAVDTANSTATLSALLIDLSKDTDLSNYYTKGETDTLLNDKADDSGVVHKSGNETIGGPKTFGDNLTIYNSDDTVTPRGLAIRNAQWLMGESGGLTASTINFLDKNAAIPASIIASKGSSGQSFLRLGVRTKDSQYTYAEEIYYNIDTLGNVTFRPWHDNTMSLGASIYKWKDTHTYLINGINPGALFIPQDRNARLDISSYFTNTANAAINRYTPLNDGYIYLSLSDVVTAHCVSQTSSNLINYGQTFGRTSAGQLYCLFPVRKGDNFACQWYTTSAAVTVSNAFFIPCKGNV